MAIAYKYEDFLCYKIYSNQLNSRKRERERTIEKLEKMRNR